jgi:hypothetical protein
VAVDYEALDIFYRAWEGGEMVPWKRNGRWRVEFFNTSVLRRREEGAAPASEGERSTQGSCRYPADWVPLRTRLKSSPTAPDPAPGIGGLWHCHVSLDAGPASQ